MVIGADPGPASPSPRTGERELAPGVELADMAEGERSQERPARRGGHHPMTEHRFARSSPEHLDVIDAVAARRHRVGLPRDPVTS